MEVSCQPGAPEASRAWKQAPSLPPCLRYAVTRTLRGHRSRSGRFRYETDLLHAAGPGTCMSRECWVLSRTGLRDGPISQEEFYTLWHVRVWCRNLKNAAALTCVGLLHQRKKAKPLAPMANRTTNRRHSARIQVAAPTALSRLQSTKLKSYSTSGVHKYSNNLGTTSNFLALQRWFTTIKAQKKSVPQNGHVLQGHCAISEACTGCTIIVDTL